MTNKERLPRIMHYASDISSKSSLLGIRKQYINAQKLVVPGYPI